MNHENCQMKRQKYQKTLTFAHLLVFVLVPAFWTKSIVSSSVFLSIFVSSFIGLEHGRCFCRMDIHTWKPTPKKMSCLDATGR
jgi:hypothetical protein